VHAKGALHIHSKLSRDGTLTIAELVKWYKRNGYQFLAMGEHAEDMNDEKVQTLLQQSAEYSDSEFCVIPGVEFAVTRHMHIVSIGGTDLIREKNPVDVVEQIHRQGAFAVLAHPKRIGWDCPRDVLLAVDAAEIWNINYDGKHLPSSKAFNGFRRMQEINPKLLAVAAHDFHRTASFYDVGVEMEVESLTSSAIMNNLRQGRYAMRSRFFRADSTGRISRIVSFSLSLISDQLAHIRRARSFFLRWSS
jgi:predicted metal-dependent phosphoesterase TrpH